MIVKISAMGKNRFWFIIIFFVLIVIAISLPFFLKKWSNKNDSKFVTACENVLINNFSDYKVCKIEKGKIVTLEGDQLSADVHPRDRIIFSININKLTSTNTKADYSTTSTLKGSPDRSLSLCYTIYPVLMSNFLNSNQQNQYVFTEQEISSLYNQYIEEFKWKDFLKGTGLEASRNINFICTKPFLPEQVQTISFIIKLSSANLLNSTEKNGIVNSDLRKYGVKILLANDKLMTSSYSRDDILTNYNSLLPLAVFTNNIAY